MTTEHETARVILLPIRMHLNSKADLSTQAFLISKRQREITCRFKSQADLINYRKIAQAGHVCSGSCNAKTNAALSEHAIQ